MIEFESGQVLEVVKGRGTDILRPISVRLISARTNIQAIATDMSRSYRKAISQYAGDGVAMPCSLEEDARNPRAMSRSSSYGNISFRVSALISPKWRGFKRL